MGYFKKQDKTLKRKTCFSGQFVQEALKKTSRAGRAFLRSGAEVQSARNEVSRLFRGCGRTAAVNAALNFQGNTTGGITDSGVFSNNNNPDNRGE